MYLNEAVTLLNDLMPTSSGMTKTLVEAKTGNTGEPLVKQNKLTTHEAAPLIKSRRGRGKVGDTEIALRYLLSQDVDDIRDLAALTGRSYQNTWKIVRGIYKDRHFKTGNQIRKEQEDAEKVAMMQAVLPRYPPGMHPKAKELAVAAKLNVDDVRRLGPRNGIVLDTSSGTGNAINDDAAAYVAGKLKIRDIEDVAKLLSVAKEKVEEPFRRLGYETNAEIKARERSEKLKTAQEKLPPGKKLRLKDVMEITGLGEGGSRAVAKKENIDLDKKRIRRRTESTILRDMLIDHLVKVEGLHAIEDHMLLLGASRPVIRERFTKEHYKTDEEIEEEARWAKIEAELRKLPPGTKPRVPLLADALGYKSYVVQHRLEKHCVEFEKTKGPERRYARRQRAPLIPKVKTGNLKRAADLKDSGGVLGDYQETTVPIAFVKEISGLRERINGEREKRAFGLLAEVLVKMNKDGVTLFDEGTLTLSKEAMARFREAFEHDGDILRQYGELPVLSFRRGAQQLMDRQNNFTVKLSPEAGNLLKTLYTTFYSDGFHY